MKVIGTNVYTFFCCVYACGDVAFYIWCKAAFGLYPYRNFLYGVMGESSICL